MMDDPAAGFVLDSRWHIPWVSILNSLLNPVNEKTKVTHAGWFLQHDLLAPLCPRVL